MGEIKKKSAKAADKLASKNMGSSAGKSGKSKPAAIIAAARGKAYTDETPSKAFAHFRPLAEQVPPAGLTVFTGQPLLLRANILTALTAIEPHLEAAVRVHREPQLQTIFELPSLIMALEFAVGRVPIAKLSAGEIEKMLTEGAPWRELMLSFLEVAAHPLINLLPRERVAAVRAGTGKLDQAEDFVAIPGLFAEFASNLAGKNPFPPEKIELLSVLGGTLVKHIRPGNAVVEVARRSQESILRDQLASMVADRYDHLQVLATIALGKRTADELLPALRTAIAVGRSSSVSAAALPTKAADPPVNGAPPPPDA